MSDEPGHNAVFVQPFPGPGPKTRIDDNGGTEPIWSRDGKELHYRSGEGTINSVELHYDEGLRAGRSRVRVADMIASPNIEEAAYDVMPDGSFVYIRNVDSSTRGLQIRFVTNWFVELKRLAPPDN